MISIKKMSHDQTKGDSFWKYSNMDGPTFGHRHDIVIFLIGIASSKLEAKLY